MFGTVVFLAVDPWGEFQARNTVKQERARKPGSGLSVCQTSLRQPKRGVLGRAFAIERVTDLRNVELLDE